MKTILIDAVGTFVSEEGEVYKDIYELLESFPNPKIILTNANDDESKQFGLDRVPYEVFTLNHQPDKTDPEYFETMLKHFGLNSSDVVYFEHNPDAVKSAESVGIKTFFYDNDKKDLEGLKRFLAENL